MLGGDVGRYYEAALRTLAFVEGRRATGRRFGADADARWSAFRGALTAADRIDLLLRDADTEWPAAFGGRVIYELGGLADDEPFGAAWPSLDPVDAEELWRRRRAAAAAPTVKDAVVAIADAWGLRLELTPCSVAATDRVILAGPSAIASATIHFAAHPGELDWARQVTVVATPPAHRHLACAAAALLNLATPTTLLATTGAALDSAGALVLTSPDAHPDDLARIARVPRA